MQNPCTKSFVSLCNLYDCVNLQLMLLVRNQKYCSGVFWNSDLDWNKFWTNFTLHSWPRDLIKWTTWSFDDELIPQSVASGQWGAVQKAQHYHKFKNKKHSDVSSSNNGQWSQISIALFRSIGCSTKSNVKWLFVKKLLLSLESGSSWKNFYLSKGNKFSLAFCWGWGW